MLSSGAIHNLPIRSDSISTSYKPQGMTWRSQQDLQKNPLSTNPFWERASAEPPLEWFKWAAIVKMAVFAKDGIELRNLLRDKPEVTLPTEPILEDEIQVETEAQRKNREVRNKKNATNGKTDVKKLEKRVLCATE